MSTVLDSIPKMEIQDMINLWINALRILNSPEKSRQHPLARNVVAAIRSEWERRRWKSPDPNEFFRWPSTEADRGRGDLFTNDWVKFGVLQFVGYKVGLDGEVSGLRQRILQEIFSGPIPPVFEPSYLEEWGLPGSPGRLRKLADTLAALTRNGKRRRDSRMAAAIKDWERDLEYLYYEYYIGRFYFDWPTTSV